MMQYRGISIMNWKLLLKLQALLDDFVKRYK